jgi:ATP/maltotriose-dependent transcriptional regulator MalT
MRLLAAGVLDGVPARAWHVLDRVVTSRQGFRPSSRFRARILARMLRWWLAHSGDPERLRAFDALGELGGVQGLSPFMRMQYLLYQSGVEFFQGRPRVALEMLEDGLREARHAGLISMFAMWFGAAATAAIAAGEIGRAQELLLEMAETHTSGRQIEAFMEFLRAKVEVAEGRVLVARDKLERSLAISLDSGATMPEAMVRLGLAFVHGEQGQTNEAYRQLRATFPALRRMGLVLCTATGLMIRAELAIRRGRSEWARVLLRRALSIAPRKGYLYLEWWSTAWLARLCAFALEHDIEPKHVRMLIRAYQLAPPRGDVVPEAWP